MTSGLTVLHVSQPVGVGVPQYVAALVRDQLARGWRVAVASPPQERRLRAAVLSAGGIHYGWRAQRNPGLGLSGEIAQLRTIIKATSPDLIHLHSSVAGLVGRLVVRGRLPTVFQPHGWSFHALKGALRTVGVGWERFGARWADATICVSEGERRAGEAAAVRGRWRVIKNGVDLEAYSEAPPEEKHCARARLGLPPQGPIAVCIGRLSRAKGQDMLVEVWPAVRTAVADARLFLVGDGPERPQLPAGPGVILVGHREDVGDWIAASDVVALPSRWEGMSLAMLEAMARGRSVVSTDVAGARETIGDAAGAIVDLDPQQLAAALAERLLHPDLATSEGRAGRRIVEAFHDAQTTLDAVASLYRELVGPSAASGAVRDEN